MTRQNTQLYDQVITKTAKINEFVTGAPAAIWIVVVLFAITAAFTY